MLTRLLAGMVFEVGVTDLETFLAVPVALLLVAVAANLIPPLRAARIDPAEAMKQE